MRRQLVLILTLCLAIGSPLLAYEGGRLGTQRALTSARSTAPPDLLGRFWHHLTALWGAAGCGGDPDGVKCSAAATQPPGQTAILPPAPAGCGADPSGLCSR